MNFLRLRRTPKLAVPKHETDTFFVDTDGVFKKMAPDGTVSEVGGGGGGGSSVITRQTMVNGSDVTINNGSTQELLWDGNSTGDELLDVTDPLSPAVVDTGVYAVSVAVNVDAAMTADGVYYVRFRLDLNGDVAEIRAVSAPAVTASIAEVSFPLVLSMTRYIHAGIDGGLSVRVTNKDGTQNLPFYLASAIIQRLS